MNFYSIRKLLMALPVILGLSLASLPASASPASKCVLLDAAEDVAIVKKIKKIIVVGCKNKAKGLALANKVTAKATAKANKRVPKLFAAGKCDPDFVASTLDANDDGVLDDYPKTPTVFGPGDLDITFCDGIDDPMVP